MTEAEWLTSDEGLRMVLRGPKPSERQHFLILAACCRRFWKRRRRTRYRVTPADVELLADGLPNAFDQVSSEGSFCWGSIGNAQAGFVSAGIGLHRPGDESYYLRAECPEAALAEIMREIQGNPFRPALRQCANQPAVLTRMTLAEVESHGRGGLWVVPGTDWVYDTAPPTAWLSWKGGTVPRLMEAIYANRTPTEGDLDNGAMAILADALEEAGCTNAEILLHCRSGGRHAFGCWVLDQLRGSK